MSKTVAAYIRVSSRGQKLDGQRAEIQRWLASNGIDDACVEWYADRQSGKTLDRPEFQRLQADMFAGRIRTVVLWKLDRVSRRLRDGVELLAGWCERSVRVVVVTQQIELSGAVGRMLAAVLLGLAEIELEYRAERQAAGISVAKRRGVYRGRQPGSTKGKPERARELRRRGLTIPEVSEALGISGRTVLRYCNGDKQPAS